MPIKGGMPAPLFPIFLLISSVFFHYSTRTDLMKFSASVLMALGAFTMTAVNGHSDQYNKLHSDVDNLLKKGMLMK